MRRQVELDNAIAAELAGSEDAVLRALEGHLDCKIFLRGNVLTLEGEEDAVDAAAALVRELSELIAQGHEIAPGTIEAVTRALDQHESPAEILEDVVWRHRATKVAPKTVNQKRYVDSIRDHTITFGIGPAGTGKTFLAVALAAAALSRREVNRIILTRPAVEAGERLGFLPGDLMAKVDPYLRPLFDALHDMLEPERVSQHLERGAIEVAPLAFMRGRSQPLSSGVLTPWGFRSIGSIRVGDLVIGSDGQPTPVIGVYPQGRKEVVGLRAQDGASTLCCTEHLWQVLTPEDRDRGTPGRVLEAREMMGRLGSSHGQRYQLPLLSAPAEFPERHVPTDPYDLGCRLGASEGWPTNRNIWPVSRPPSPSALATADTEVETAGIPEEYLHNSAAVRVALLQGLLDAGGAPDAAGIRLATPSPILGDGAVYLVRSLGGIAYRREPCVLDIRLPEARGEGRPMRFVDAIEPVGKMETVCIQVAAADSLYVTDDFLVTHNTLNDSFIILDEAQNTSPEQMKMFLTRLGFNSKMVVTGDITQIDLPREQDSGLVVVSEILDGVEGIEFVRFGDEDVVRHKLVRRIVAAYNDHAQRLAPELRPRKRA